jgi:acetyl-CoA C-acetyltransferase
VNLRAPAYVVSAVRTPVGRRGGGLAQAHPADLGAHVLSAVVERVGVDPGAIDDVIMGCVDQVGAQASNIARTAVLSAGFPEHVPATTIDRQCGSSQQAAHFAAQAVASGTQDLVIAAGVEVMSLVPLGTATTAGRDAGLGEPRSGEGWRARFGDEVFSQFTGAELIAEHWSINRDQMERFALESHQRAIRAADEGLFDAEIVPWEGITRDEGPRPDSNIEKMQSLQPLIPGGQLTAAVSSQISDGAAALLIASQRAVNEHGLTPLARISAIDVVGSDPRFMLSGPIPATSRILDKAGLTMSDIGHFEVNEAFAPVILAWAKELNADLSVTNPLGGAIALGHPLGATGARLMTTLVHSMRRTGIQRGLQVMCEGGGMANATLLELVD